MTAELYVQRPAFSHSLTSERLLYESVSQIVEQEFNSKILTTYYRSSQKGEWYRIIDRLNTARQLAYIWGPLTSGVHLLDEYRVGYTQR